MKIGTQISQIYPCESVSLFSEQATRPADTDRDDNSCSLRLCASAGAIFGTGVNHMPEGTGKDENAGRTTSPTYASYFQNRRHAWGHW